MDCKDLMVGDWANIKGKPVKVTLDDLRTMLILFEDVDFHIEPIPLTEDILVKNGFIFNKGYAVLQVSEDTYLDFYKHEHRLRKVWKGIDEWNNHAKVRDVTFVCQCYYVHEFQHALRLAGVQKEIEL